MHLPIDPIAMLRPRRKITGMSAVLLPFEANGEVAWAAFREHVMRTHRAGLVPAVNMDTGYISQLDSNERVFVLAETFAEMCGSPFVAGAFVADNPGDRFNVNKYRREIDLIHDHGGMPVIFQSYGLTSLGSDELLNAYRAIARDCDKFIAFELGTEFAPFGKIYDLDTYAGLLDIPQCIGAKHSSLSRELEWQRLRLRDAKRPDFMVLTGNDLGIDMVMYGSDYLLGLSTFAPEEFALRDRYWLEGDPRFYELNDVLQYLGTFAFRPPVPAYKHSAAQFLHLRGWIPCDRAHPRSPTRPESDRAVLNDILQRLKALTADVELQRHAH
jgi:dihydrodipicolinate synthase/N-acetylneuraminate lyase